MSHTLEFTQIYLSLFFSSLEYASSPNRTTQHSEQALNPPNSDNLAGLESIAMASFIVTASQELVN
jgi:hypothetical protein